MGGSKAPGMKVLWDFIRRDMGPSPRSSNTFYPFVSLFVMLEVRKEGRKRDSQLEGDSDQSQ